PASASRHLKKSEPGGGRSWKRRRAGGITRGWSKTSGRANRASCAANPIPGSPSMGKNHNDLISHVKRNFPSFSNLLAFPALPVSKGSGDPGRRQRLEFARPRGDCCIFDQIGKDFVPDSGRRIDKVVADGPG